ncbi:MAG: UDP-N-acetylmuramyl-tripeptide synthetase [Candidatus Magasanikbacteria bacterium]
MFLKNILKQLVPKKVVNISHLFWAWWGAVKYHHPSEELMVIGITGTSGKSSTLHFLRQVLEYAGHKVGSLSTVDFYIAGENKLNDQKMTMLGKMQIQKYLRKMVDNACDIAIVETTSEGGLQYRHKFINYDMIVLTNLYPEHIESHGSFEKYKQAKIDIFEYASQCKTKQRGKIAVVNGESEYADEFLQFDFDQKIKCMFADKHIEVDNAGIHFEIHGYRFSASLYGKHNAENLIEVVEIARAMDIDWHILQEAIGKITSTPGRIEFISGAKEKGFDVIVDYAFEPGALNALYEVVDLLKPAGKIIHVCGSTGGGRDKARRIPIGKLVGKKSDVFIVTDEDPYDEDPGEIIKTVSQGAQQVGKKLGESLFEILNRKEAIEKAIKMAQPGDLILVTGKGSEQKMCVAGGKLIEWDDRKIVKDLLKVK